MKFRRIFTPAVLIVTLLVQFLPGTVFAPRPVAAATCDLAEFVADVTIPDGTSFAPGAALIKTWRFKNVGTCTWSTSYAIVFYSGTKMGAPSAVNMPTSVAPGASVDVTVNMTAPTTAGHYRGYWMLRNASSTLFGVGPYGTYWFFIDIVVGAGGYSSATYDFVANYCSAVWTSGAGTQSCPGTDGSASGYVIKSTAPKLEDGSIDTSPGLIVAPNFVTDGYISGTYPAITVQSGDRFQSIVSCQFGVASCYVTFQLNYQIGSGPVYTLWQFREKTEGLYYRANVNLSSLAGQSVKFTLKVMASGSPEGDRVLWGGARIVHTGSVVPPGPPPTPAPTTTIITADAPDSSLTGQSVAVSVTVNGAFTTPTGIVSITGADTNCALALSGGSGSCNVVFTTTGVKTLTATYGGDANYIGSSDTESHTVVLTKAASGTTITNDIPDPSNPGQAVVVSVTVSGAGIPTPTGNVNITGADTNCTILLAGGSGSCSASFTSTGARTLTASYVGDGNYAPSSGTASHTVNKGSTTTTIYADLPDPSAPTQAIPVSVSVIGAGVTPTGTVDITGADINCTITLSGGSGSCSTVTFNTIGAKILTATYNGDGNYLSSWDTETHSVLNATTTVITSDNLDPSIPGDAVTVVVTVTGAGGTPTGTVDITGADVPCTIGALVAGTGSCAVTFNTAGAKILTATYNGDPSFTASLGTATHTVDKGPTVTLITSDAPDPSLPFASVPIVVTVTAAAGVIPTGSVGISISGGVPSTCNLTLSSAVPLVPPATGTCNVVFNISGTFTITATYSGDGNYLPSLVTEAHVVP